MTAIETRDWQSRNQAGLAEALAGLKAVLRRHADRGERTTSGSNGPIEIGEAPPPPEEPALSASEAPGVGVGVRQPEILEALQAAFGLSPFERDLLLLCAGIELDSTVAPLCAAAQGDPSRSYPTFSLGLAVLPDAHWSALSPEAPLRKWRLIEVGVGPALTVSPLRIDERVLHHLVGLVFLDERLAGLVEPVAPIPLADLAPSHAAVAGRLADAWSSHRGHRPIPVIQLCGPDPADRRAVAASAASSVGLRLVAMPADLIPAPAAELDALVRLWEREAALSGSVLLIECDDADPAADQSTGRRVIRLIERIAGPAIVSGRERRPVAHRPAIGFDVFRPTPAEQRAAWRAALGSSADGDGTEGDGLAAQFSLGLPAIRSAAAEAIARTADVPGKSAALAAWDVCRALCRTRLDDLAQRIDPAAGWDDLVLPGSPARGHPPGRPARPPPGHRLRRLGLRRQVGAGAGHRRPVRRRQRHRQDDGRRGPGGRAAPGPLSDRPGRRGQQVYRRDREEPAPGLRRGGATAVRSCCSTRPTPSSASGVRSRTATTATPTSRSATCCSGWRPTAAWPS